MKEWNHWFMRFFLVFMLLAMNTISWGSEFNSLEKSTTDLINLSTMNKDQMLTQAEINQWINTAKSRLTALDAELQKNPEAVAKFFLPEKISNTLPNQLKPYIETEINHIQGTLELRTAIYHAKEEKIQYLLHVDNGDLYSLYFIGENPKGFHTGATVEIRHGFKIQTAPHRAHLLVSAEELILLNEKIANAIPESLGPQKTIVILVNFQNNPSSQPWTVASVRDTVFNTINNMFYESSYHQTTVVGNVVGWYTIPMNSNASCSAITDDLPGYADSAATAGGVNLNAYDRRVYMFPRNSNCGWGGYGSIGKWGDYSMAWINGYNTASLTGHELGHNLGLYHSNYLQCSGSTNSGNCSTIEYGDNADIMGDGDTAHFNAFQKDNLGWLNYQNSPPIQTITASGTFTIDPYETLNSNVKALKVLKGTRTNGSNDYYYLEFRQGIGFDKELATCSNCDFTQGILLHQGNDQNANSSVILDLTPNDNNPNKVALLPGQTFQDPNTPNGGTSFTVNSVSSTGATVSINFGGQPPTCVRALQTMSISPTTTQYVAPGGSASYLITVVNRDSAVCSSSTYNLSTTVPAGITASLNNTSLVVSPGKTGTATLQVNSSSTTGAGVYSVPVKAVNAANSSNVTSVTANFGVQTSTCTRANPTVTLTPSIQTGRPGTTLTYTVGVKNNDRSNCARSTFNLKVSTPSGFSWYIRPTRFTLNPGASSTGIFSATSSSNVRSGDYTIKATVTNSSNTSATGSAQAIYRVRR